MFLGTAEKSFLMGLFLIVSILTKLNLDSNNNKYKQNKIELTNSLITFLEKF